MLLFVAMYHCTAPVSSSGPGLVNMATCMCVMRACLPPSRREGMFVCECSCWSLVGYGVSKLLD